MVTPLKNANHIPHIGVVSLGCPKNLVDSQRLISVLMAKGYRIENDFSNADLVIVNTCGFIEPAVQESFEEIYAAHSQCSKVMVMGCLGTQKERILEEFPQVADVIGPGRRAAVLRSVEKLVGVPPAIARQSVPSSGVLLTPAHYAYLKVSEGCRHRCTFCIIPDLRGPLHSRPIDNIFAEAQDLVTRGIREIMVIAQDTSDYGFDLKNGTDLIKLIERLATLTPRPWIRLHYVYPSKIVDELIPFMNEGIILPYLDMPLQHASQKILKLMKRPGNTEQVLERIENWRSKCPDLALRSTFITGFPGETEDDFEQLLDFIEQAQLDHVGTFPYSDIKGAQANSFADKVDIELANERAAELMELQAEISTLKLRSRVNESFEMIVDKVTDEGDIVARTKYEAPDIDGIVSVTNDTDISVKEGDLIKARIVDNDAYDMEAVFEENITPTSHIAFKRKL